MIEFKLGDIVQMKSSGPIMTVEMTGQDGRVTCHWFDDKKKQEVGSFPAVVLQYWE